MSKILSHFNVLVLKTIRPTLLLLFFVITCFAVHGQITLKIVIKNLESNKGNVLVDFRDGKDQQIKGYTANISNNQSIITISGLKPGKYAFKYFHDANNNKELDTNWVGMPTEGFGFSNNAKSKFGPPAFENTVFELKKDMTLECKAIYL